tara:strand:+ start:3180 stop:4430 length:1251 start_codon:yes stop_codon:yes gene_type:complete
MDFAQKALKRVAVSGLIISIVAGAAGWKIAKESAEQETVNLALEVSQSIVSHFDIVNASIDNLAVRAQQATDNLVLDWFDIAELYDKDGVKISESITAAGELIETALPHHEKPSYQQASYQSLTLDDGNWALRTFVPIKNNGHIWGYLEGVRMVPEWQRADIRNFSLLLALISAGAAWLCALVIYPLILILNKENQHYIEKIKQSNIDMMYAMGKAIALRDSDTGAHNYRVAWIASELAEAYGLDNEAMKALILGSYLHDIGKIAISDKILLKPGKLSEDEMAVMKTHVQEGVVMVDGIAWLSDAKTVIEAHHEKWDGSGYPNRLVGKAIPISARIFAIADVFDALCSKRPYKEPFSYDKALSIIQESQGSHFDPSLVAMFEGLAKGFYNTISIADEASCRTLMSNKIDKYFYNTK